MEGINIYATKQRWKMLLFLLAIVIGIGSLMYTNTLVEMLSHEEKKKIQLWAEATSLLAQEDAVSKDLNLYISQQPLSPEEKLRSKLWGEANFSLESSRGMQNLYLYLTQEKVSAEQKTLIQLWGEANIHLDKSETATQDLNLYLTQVIQDNTTVPVILVDGDGNMLSRNLDSVKIVRKGYLENQLKVMKEQNPPIQLLVGNGQKNFIYFKESTILTELKWYPYIQLGLIIILIMVAYFAFSSSRHAEQNQVWVGLSKETAHQLGTPASSLSAWVEVLKYHVKDGAIITELEKDVNRLKIITDRFSKIGSMPKLGPVNLRLVLENVIEYIQNRISNRSEIQLKLSNDNIIIPINISLFEWVIENLLKNSLDAMQGEGVLSVNVSEHKNEVYVDIVDTGKGIPKKLFKTIFKPGFTTKSRGWGLGLSLAKRIIEMYHKGKIFVLQSEIEKGTTIRIILNKSLKF
jgi:nitrogen-specific signal transduction histidine kinase